MSGPIVRKYGFPNFEKIFGERELKHGADGEPETQAPPPPPAEPLKASPGSGPAGAESTPSKP